MNDSFVAAGTTDALSTNSVVKPESSSAGLSGQNLLQTAGSATQLAGADPKLTAALGTSSQVAGVAQQLDSNPAAAGAGLLSSAASISSLAGADPKVAQSMQLAQGASSAFSAARAAADKSAADIRPEPSYLDDNPKTGQAITDFAPPASPYVPQSVDARGMGTVSSSPSGLTQHNRLLRFYGPLKAEKQLFLVSLSGQAKLSNTYEYRLRLMAQSSDIDLKDMLAKNVCIGIQLQDSSEFPINGYVSQFAYSHSDGGHAYYDASVVPWLWYLNHRVNSRIYQDLSVIDVIEQLFKDNYGGLASFDVRTSGSYKPENYVVQYDETDFNFFSRLMEQYGLFYYFEHTPTTHKLIICDDSSNSSFCPPQTHHAEIRYNAGHRVEHEDCITHLAAQRSFQPSSVALNTFDFKAPSSQMYVELPTVSEQGEVPKLEVYHGNPAFAYKNASEGQQAARLLMEAAECQAKLFMGTSECRGLEVGHSFKVLGHHWFEGGDATSNDFILCSVDIQAHNNFGTQTEDESYRNTLTCIRRKIPYRPQRIHQKPVMKGPQTATVVGPKGVEIHTDKFGRIKAHFHWDRYGRYDDRSSCWIRVSQPWAGKGWGTVAIPRIGQEVVIDFLEGDPDRPLCTGRLFNAEQSAPYALPDGAHQMGFRSRSTPGGGGHCEVVIHDKAGSELINIHSQKDMVTTVQNNQQTIINGPQQTVAVTKGMQVTTVKKAIQIESETENVFIKAQTNVTIALSEDHQVVLDKDNGLIALVVGSSKIVMGKDGAISIEGKSVSIKGPDGIQLNC